jgi:uncharacterized protein YgiM (DUF1202 family)
MAHGLASLTLFSAVALLSGTATIGGLNFTADTVARVAAANPVKTTNRKPSYIAYLPEVKPEAFNIAKSVPVTPVVPKQAPGPLAASPAPTFTHTVAVESLRVRSGPRKTSPQILALKGGTQVSVIKEERGWVLIMAGGDQIGWVYSKLLRAADRRQALAQ